jgi:hypothetical protein
MEHAGWIVVGGLLCSLIGAFIHWLFARKDCSQCGLKELRDEILRLRSLIESLWETAGKSVKDRLELEAIKRE